MEILELVIRLREALDLHDIRLADELAWELEIRLREQDDAITELSEASN
jgi:hypothetical protein